jgi:dipeptidyl aminopeptidase/acylaminoacyl peptidase
MSALPAISSDGNLVAFISDRAGENNLDLWVRHIAQPEPVRLTRHPADELHPRFSPDGSRIVFRSDRDGSGLYVVNALGGGLHKVAGRGLFPMFTPDGRDIVFTEDPMWLRAGGLLRMFRVPAAGGPPSPFLPDWGVYRPPGSAGPVFSPDGRLVLFNGAPLDDPSQRDWWVVPVEGGEPWSSRASGEIRAIDVVQFPTAWYRDRLILAAGTTIEGLNLYSAKISDDGLISGPITPLTAGPGMSWRPSVSDAGRVALSRFSWVIHLWEVSLDPETGEGIGAPRRITDDAAPKFSFSLSRDGNLLAYSAYAGPRGNRQAEVVLVDRESGNRTVPVTLAEDRSSTSTYPRLSGDGSLLGWSSFEQGRRVAWTGPVDEPVGRELCRDCRIVDFFDGGRQVLVHRFGRGLSRIVRNDGDEEPVLETGERALLDADLSPDARWLAVKLGHPDDTVSIAIVSRGEVVAPADDWIHVAGGDRWVGSPRWSADGAILYFLTDRDDHICVWGQRIDPATKRPVGEAFPVVHAHGSNMNTLSMSRFMWNLEVGDDRLVFNAGELTGDVYTAMLE